MKSKEIHDLVVDTNGNPVLLFGCPIYIEKGSNTKEKRYLKKTLKELGKLQKQYAALQGATDERTDDPTTQDEGTRTENC